MSSNRKQMSFWLALIPSLILFLGASVLVAMTLKTPAQTADYWEYFAIAVIIISLISGLAPARGRGQSFVPYMLKQVIQWGAIVAVFYAIQQFGFKDALGPEKYTLGIVFLLALASIFVGLHMDLKFFLFGAFMAFCGFIMVAPANLAQMKSFADNFGIADVQSNPQPLVYGLAFCGFVLALLVLMNQRSAAMTRRARLNQSKADA